MTEAMRRTPPKTTRPVRRAIAAPMTHGSHAASASKVVTSVLVIVLA